MKKSVFSFLLIAAMFVLLSASASGQISIITITANENCSGTLNSFAGLQSLPCTFGTDPGPGGLASVMTYGMRNPPGLVGGDVILQEGDIRSDLIRFDPTVGNGSFFFYSDLDGGADTAGDFGLPTAFNTNVVRINEVSLGTGDFGAIYTPVAGQPGFVAGASVPVSYTFISDSVPEPATWVLGLAGASLIAIRKLRISRK
jgi:hypothetical protein